MLRVKKIETLKPRVRVRKLGGIFHEAYSANIFDSDYIEDCFNLLLSQELLSDKDRGDIKSFYNKGKEGWEDIYYRTLYILGEAPADWDIKTEGGDIDWSKRTVKEHYLYLDHLRSPYNVGSLFRSAESFGVKEIFVSPGTADPLHPRATRTSRGTVNGVDWDWKDISDINMPVFALELGGEDIRGFNFPRKGVCIIGSEESGVSPEALRIADNSLGRVSIKQYGAKGSINVAAATAILLQHWMEKEENEG